ncbi:MAG: glucosaminidase domain-containing protein, partial [Ferruginibacter sp.]
MKWILFLLLPIVSVAQSRQTAAQYIEKYEETAKTEMRRYGIPASIKLGQGILESSAGNSDLAMEANNHFGIKCKKDWTGPAFNKDDDAKDECFRKYESVLASYEDHSQFLKNSSRYASLFLLSQDDYKGWAHGLKQAGYATNPKYAQLLIKTIEENRLFQYDTEVLAKPYVPENSEQKLKDVETTVLPISSKQEILYRNNVKYIIARDGDTPETLSDKFDLIP